MQNRRLRKSFNPESGNADRPRPWYRSRGGSRLTVVLRDNPRQLYEFLHRQRFCPQFRVDRQPVQYDLGVWPD